MSRRSVCRLVFTAAVSGFLVSSCHRQIALTDHAFIEQSAAAIRSVQDADRPALRPLKRRGLIGDAAAAGTLSQIYDRCAFLRHTPGEPIHPPVEVECLKRAKIWDRIAAENGSPAAAASEAQALLSRGTCEDVYRARYWLAKTLKWHSGTPWKEMSARLARLEKECGW